MPIQLNEAFLKPTDLRSGILMPTQLQTRAS